MRLDPPSMWISDEGWNGVPAWAFKAAMIEASRSCGLDRRAVRLGLFVASESVDETGTPLVRLYGKQKIRKMSFCVRDCAGEKRVSGTVLWPVWPKWRVRLTVQHDNNVLSHADVTTLLAVAGYSVGVGRQRLQHGFPNGGWKIQERKRQ